MKCQERDIEQQRYLRHHALHGADNTPLVVTLASMNFYLHDIGIGDDPDDPQETLIACQDSLIKAPNRRYDVVLTIPCSDLRARLLSLPCISSQICTRTAC